MNYACLLMPRSLLLSKIWIVRDLVDFCGGSDFDSTHSTTCQ